jgi:hypothetical protein
MATRQNEQKGMPMWVTVDLYEHDAGDEQFNDEPVDDKINLLGITGEIKKQGNRYRVAFCDQTVGFLDEADYVKVESALKTMHEHSRDADLFEHHGESS